MRRIVYFVTSETTVEQIVDLKVSENGTFVYDFRIPAHLQTPQQRQNMLKARATIQTAAEIIVAKQISDHAARVANGDFQTWQEDKAAKRLNDDDYADLLLS